MQDFFAFKIQVHQACLNLLESRIGALQENIGELRAAAQDSSKSSAGDKHETGRAMADLEIEKQLGSLHLAQQQLATLKQLDPSQKRERAIIGAMVQTNQGIFYLCIALGKITVQEKEVLVISTDAPIAGALGKTQDGQTLQFNGRSYENIRVF